MLPSPFAWMTPLARRRSLWLVLPLNLLVMFCLQGIGHSLIHAPEAPRGILSFEFAGTFEQANRIIGAWLHPGARFAAGLSLGLDYLFMPLYATSIALCCVLVSAGGAPWLERSGRWLAWAQFVAALLDAVENYALIQLLLGATGEGWPALAWYCAAVKFALVILGVAFVFLLAGPIRLWRHGQLKQSAPV